jgi:polysaccharide deacetylase family protein (PEP-CTERM system associated)
MTARVARPGDPVVNAMSIDVEDYFQVSAFDRVVQRSLWDRMESRVVANTDRLLAMFDEFSVKSTFFVLGWVAERHPDLVRRIAASGHEVASHGYGHRLIYEQTPADFREDVRRAKRLLEDIAGAGVDGYRAPSYSVTAQSLWALDVLIEEGHTYDSSIFPIRHDRYGMPDAPRHPHVISRAAGQLAEAPPSTVRWASMNLPVAGGGYFRLLPYWWTKWGIARINRTENLPAIFYLHPWEVDPDQPRLPATGLSRFRHYRHLGKTEARLRRLMTDFRFAPVRTILEGVRSAARIVSRDPVGSGGLEPDPAYDGRSAARIVSREHERVTSDVS